MVRTASIVWTKYWKRYSYVMWKAIILLNLMYLLHVGG